MPAPHRREPGPIVDARGRMVSITPNQQMHRAVADRRGYRDTLMPLDTDAQADGAVSALAVWLEAFGTAVEAADRDQIARCFAADSHWRDLVAFGWDIRTISGNDAIAGALADGAKAVGPNRFHIPADRAQARWVSRAGTDCIEALFAFETRHGNAAGVVRLVPSETGPGGHAAWIVSTCLDDLSKHGITEADHIADDAYSRDFGGENWLDKRTRRRAYEDREPSVVVVGAGQAGLGIAARLTALGIDTLIVEKHERIGDNWRKRYHSLTLHNEAHVNHLPYIPFPITFPTFIPKDKLGNWFEAYADAMDLNAWTSTELVSGGCDEATGRWSLTLRRNGSERVVKPRHVVFATGVSAIPVMPDIPGMDTFGGTLIHSGSYTDGVDWKGKNAVVFGTGNSAHDVAQDLHCSGAHVTMVQRSTTYIVSLQQAQKVYALYEEGLSVDDCDLITTAGPYAFLLEAYKRSTAEMREVDKPLHDALTARGFKLDFGEPDDTGFQMKYLRRGGGYYFNVGCSDLIADGSIDLIHYEDFEAITETGLAMKDGRVIPADLIVAATGYKNQQETVRQFLGSDIADRIGPVWGFDEGGELANMWKPTPQPGLWFTAGSLAQCRIFSKFLALQIAADEHGLTGGA
jgi:cation diffusion facilitator CzcD-associated flavoprotein CzcO